MPRPLGEPRSSPRSFTDRLTTPLPGVRAFARLAHEGAFRPGAEGLTGIPDLPYRPAPLPPAVPGTVCVTWAGHASWVLRTGGLTVLTAGIDLALLPLHRVHAAWSRAGLPRECLGDLAIGASRAL